MKNVIITIVALFIVTCYGSVEVSDIKDDASVDLETEAEDSATYKLQCFCFDLHDIIPDPDYIVCEKLVIGERLKEMQMHGIDGIPCKDIGVKLKVDIDE